MKEKIKLIYNTNKNKINLTKYILISIILLFAVFFMDTLESSFKLYIPNEILLKKSLSETILLSLTGAFLTVTTFTFSTILTVLGAYSSNLTPRIVQKFIDKPYVLSVLGIFIGGFFYSVLSLFLLNNISDDSFVIAGLLGVIYAITSMIHFILFINQVLKSIKGSNVIQNVYENALYNIEKDSILRKKSISIDDKKSPNYKIYANATGYLFSIDYNKINKILSENNGYMKINKRIGDYVTRGVYIADIFLNKNNKIDDENIEKVGESFLFSDQKNDNQDYHRDIVNLVEIALRGLSPGINDPNIAINCIWKISNLLGKLFSNKNNFIVVKESENFKIIYNAYSVSEELYLSFNQIIHYGKSDPFVSIAILEGLLLVKMISNDEVSSNIEEYFDYVYNIIYTDELNKIDKDRIDKIKSDFYFKSDDIANEKEIKSDED